MSFGKVDVAAVDLKITIVKGDVSNSSLILDPAGIGDAYQNKKVKWVIAAGSNVGSFFITKKDGSEQIFDWYDRPPWPFYIKEGKATVKGDAPIGSIYDYTIHWKDTAGKKYHWDPKIAVKSDSLYDLDLLFYILYLVSAMVSFIFRKRFLYK
ncbi:MAG: hypothetical protein ABIN67_21800 [Ferruginibacter sp.]